MDRPRCSRFCRYEASRPPAQTRRRRRQRAGRGQAFHLACRWARLDLGSGGLNDGPLPAHYEPLESPIHNPLYPSRQANPVANRRTRPGNEYATSPDSQFPHVLTTYRLTEHHTAGGMSRTLSHLAELQPELFCELSLELARQLSFRTATG